MSSRYICTLESVQQEEIIDKATELGYSVQEIELMLNSRICDLEDTLSLSFR